MENNYYNDILNSLHNAKKSAEIEVENEINSIEELSKKDPLEIYGRIIKWKQEFFSSKCCLYSIARENLPLLTKLSNPNSEENIAKFISDNLWNYFNSKGLGLKTQKIKNFEVDTHNYIKYEILYNKSILLINILNNNHEIDFKFPLIDDFEYAVFKKIKNANQYLTDSNKELIDKYKDELNKIGQLQSKNSELKSQLELLKTETQSLLNQLKSKDNLLDLIKNTLYNYEQKPIYQFSNLVWGDNYPALEVLYNFFVEKCGLEYTWSLFSLCMSVNNEQKFNINSNTFTREDIGYLFHKIKEFFIKEIHPTKDVYNDWILSKISIDNKSIDQSFAKKFIRPYKTGKSYSLSNEDIINNLYDNIKDRYKR